MFKINNSNKMKREDFLHGIKYLTEIDLRPKPSIEKIERFGFSANDEASYYILLCNPNLTDSEREQIKTKINLYEKNTFNSFGNIFSKFCFKYCLRSNF